ncbi:hypothetical protein HMPREF2802_08975 [Staphylococcus sp. HMSC071G07]|nr:hypothetical protein HMPREF2802_08975 [Staphylococcus sp. HMSC071G07]
MAVYLVFSILERMILNYRIHAIQVKGDGATPAGIACVLRLQAQAMPAESVATPNTKYCKLGTNTIFLRIQISTTHYNPTNTHFTLT